MVEADLDHFPPRIDLVDDLADQVGHRRVGGGELLGVPVAAVAPLDGQPVALLGRAASRLDGDGVEGVLTEVGAGDDRCPLVEQTDHGAQQPGLALTALAEQDDVVPGDQSPLELRDDGGLEAVQAGPGVAAFGERGQEVVPDLDPQGLLDVPRLAELADGRNGGCRSGCRRGGCGRGHEFTLPASATGCGRSDGDISTRDVTWATTVK